MRKISLLLLVCCTVTVTAKAQQKWPSTFFWRISGNGLTQPSYLYGTMHVKEKSMFWLGDSIYYYLDKVQGLALEVDPEESLGPYVQQIFEQIDFLNREEDEEEENNNRLTLSEPKPETARSKKKKWGGYKVYEPPGAAKKGEQMNVIIDGYLFYLAKEKGKWLGGLEDIADHFGFVNEVGKFVDPDNDTKENEQYNEMIVTQLRQWYQNENLEKIKDFLGPYLLENRAFIQRNRVMATRADSLSRVRSMFYAIGVGHLPGDSGVINLLRQKGFTVTPVFSTKELPPVLLSDRFDSWKTTWPADSSYSYRSPVEPMIANPKGINMKMALSYDLPKRVVYFFSAITYPKRPLENDSFGILKDIVNDKELVNGRRKYSNIKWFRYKGYPAVSANTTEAGFTFPLQVVLNKNVVYFMLCGSEDPGATVNHYAKNFFNSLNIFGPPREQEQQWVTYTDSTLGFTVNCPCTFSPLRLSRKESDSTSAYRTSECIDPNTGARFYIGVNRMLRGYFSSSDTAFFKNYKTELATVAENKQVTMEMSETGGYPSAQYRFPGDDGFNYHVSCVIKGNTRYLLMAYAPKEYSATSTAVCNRFINSLNLLTVTEQPLLKTVHPDGDITAYIPGNFSCTPTSDEIIPQGMLTLSDCQAYDTATATTFSLFKSTYNSFTWFGSDSAWLENLVHISKNFGDSLLNKQISYRNSSPVADIEFAIGMKNATRRHRYLVNGPVLYEVNAVLTSRQKQSAYWQTLFDSISFVKPQPLTLFVPKTQRVLDSLASTDSLTYSQAKSALNDAPFTTADLPGIYKAALSPAPLDTLFDYSKAGRNLIQVIEQLATKTGIDSFVQANYHSLPPNAAINQADLLYLLANNKTSNSYSLLKQLLLNHTPKKVGHNGIGFPLTDTLALAATLFPEMAKLLNDSIYNNSTALLMNRLADSGLIAAEIVKEHEAGITRFAASELDKSLRNKNEYTYISPDLLHLLARIKTPATTQLLNRYQKLTSADMLYPVFDALLKKDWPIQPAMLQKLAAAPYYRNDVYSMLKNKKLEKQFPAAYATQKTMAESYLYNYSSSEWDQEPHKLYFIKEFTAPHKGKTHRFFVFRVLYKEEDVEYSHTGISGPFAMDVKKLLPANEYSGMWIDQDAEFSPKEVNRQQKKYLEIIKENE